MEHFYEKNRRSYTYHIRCLVDDVSAIKGAKSSFLYNILEFRCEHTCNGLRCPAVHAHVTVDVPAGLL